MKMLKQLLLLAFLLAPSASFAVDKSIAQAWVMDPASSTIAYDMGNNHFSVLAMKAVINFDPNHLDQSKIMVVTDMGAMYMAPPQEDKVASLVPRPVNTGKVDETASTAIFFTSSSIQRVQANSFTTAATLTIQNISRNVAVPMTVELTKASDGTPVLTLQGSFTVNAADFMFGDTSKGTGGVGSVPVKFDIHATMAQ
jgi:polyisoprenoid-binding protein YceI